MADGRPNRRLVRPQNALAALALSLGSLAPRCSEASEALRSRSRQLRALPPRSCGHGFLQHYPIVLGCHGGDERIHFELTEVGTPQHLLFWQAPSGTEDLRFSARYHSGQAVLKVACADNGKVLIGSGKSPLGQDHLHATVDGAQWRWSGKASLPQDQSGIREVWFHVKGTLACDIDVSLSNEHSSRMTGTVKYQWAGIRKCPSVPLGCRPCSEEEAVCSDVGKIAVCDGSPYVKCKTNEKLETKKTTSRFSTTTSSTTTLQVAKKSELERIGCCFQYGFSKQGDSFLNKSEHVTKGVCMGVPHGKPFLHGKSFRKGWNATCPRDAYEADMWRKNAMKAQKDSTHTTDLERTVGTTRSSKIMTTTTTQTLATTVLITTQPTVQGDLPPSARNSTAVAEIDVNHDGKKDVYYVGTDKNDDGKIKWAGPFTMSSDTTTVASPMINTVVAATTSTSLRLTTSQEGLISTSQEGYSAQVAPSSTQRSSSTKSKPTLIPNSWIKKIRESKPSWASTAGVLGVGLAAMGSLVLISCFCVCCHCSSRSTSSRSDKQQRAVQETRRLDGAEAAKGPVGAGRLGYPPGYEPVRCEEQSVSSDHRATSMASSEAAGLRLLGHDGM